MNLLNLLIKNVKDPSKLIVLGDFNSHNTLWGSSVTNCNGRALEDFILENDLVLLYDGSGTRSDPHSGKLSKLDITLASPQIGNKCDWSVLPGILGSDHFPIIIEIHIENSHNTHADQNMDETIPSLKNIDWDKFTQLCCE